MVRTPYPLPHIDEIDGAHYAGGCCGSGVVMSTRLGTKLAQRVLGKRRQTALLRRLDIRPTRCISGGRGFCRSSKRGYQVSDVWDRALSR